MSQSLWSFAYLAIRLLLAIHHELVQLRSPERYATRPDLVVEDAEEWLARNKPQ